MNQLIAIGNNGITMTSREIAELVESRHDKVKQSIDRLIKKGVIQSPPLGNFKNINNVEGTEYTFTGEQGKRDSIIVVAQLSPEFTARLVDRWQELESGIQRTAIDLNDPAFLRSTLLTYTEKVIELQDAVENRDKIISDISPKAAALDQLELAEGNYNLTTAAKILNVPPQKFINGLNSRQWIYRMGVTGPWTAHQPHITSGHLVHKIYRQELPDGTERSRHQVLVTPKGMAKLAIIYQQHPLLEAA